MINHLKIHDRARLGIALTWQEPARFEGISVLDYLTLQRKDIDASYYLHQVGLSPKEYLDRQVDKSLSGGERKRIELASVMALRPKLALLDEPAAGIDLLSLQEILSVIRAFKDNGSSVILITHREDFAGVVDRASQLCGGRILCSGDPVKVAEHYKNRACTICNGKECLSV